MKFAMIALASLAIVSCTRETPRPDFRTALDAHLAAIQARDLDAFKATLTKDATLYTIFPNGEALTTTADAVLLHESWFKEKNWQWDGEVVRIIEGADMATAILKYEYRDMPEGEPRWAWLALVFKLEDGEWRLVHDQNTRIEKGQG